MASALFQAAMEQTIGDKFSNVFIYQEDTCIGGYVKKDLSGKVLTVLERLKSV